MPCSQIFAIFLSLNALGTEKMHGGKKLTLPPFLLLLYHRDVSRFLSIGFLVSALFLTGCLRGCRKEGETPGGITPPGAQEESLSSVMSHEETSSLSSSSEPTSTSESSSSAATTSSSEVSRPPADTRIPAAAQNKATTALPDEKVFVDAARAWTTQLRNILDNIQILRLIAEGYSAKEIFGEDIPFPKIDLFGDYALFQKASLTLIVPGTCSRADPLLEDLKTRMRTLMASLSKPPTTEELLAAEGQTPDILQVVNQLFPILNSYCQL
jgi:hypothetical protein